MLHRIVSCILILGFFLLVSYNLIGQKIEPLTLDLSPKVFVCSEWTRLQVRVLIKIDPNKDNRYLHFAYASDVGESGSSLTEMKGINSSISYTRYVWVNCNYYLFSACVLRTQGKKFCAKQEVYPP